jgi:hypothetical protein
MIELVYESLASQEAMVYQTELNVRDSTKYTIDNFVNELQKSPAH